MKLYKARFTNMPFPTSKVIYKDVVATITFKKPTVFLIKSKQVADSYKRYFEYLWEKSK